MNLVLLGEAYGANEARISRAFVGAAGIELIRLLAEAQILTLTPADSEFIAKFYRLGDPNLLDCVWNLHPEIHPTNVFNQQPPGNNLAWFCGSKTEAIPGYPALIKGKYVRREFGHELERLGEELVRHDPNLIVCLGNCALWALAGKTGIKALRGTTLYSTHTATGFKLLPTYHPAAIFRQWNIRPIVVMDLCKAKRESSHPDIRRPRREIWIEPTIADMEAFYANHIQGCSILSVDIETVGNQITCIGFAPNPRIAIVIPFFKSGKSYWKDEAAEQAAWGIARRILEDGSIRKLFQNGLYDIPFLYRSYGIRVMGASEDTMLLHHALQPESEKGLAFLGSCYANNEIAWKADHRKGALRRDD